MAYNNCGAERKIQKNGAKNNLHLQENPKTNLRKQTDIIAGWIEIVHFS